MSTPDRTPTPGSRRGLRSLILPATVAGILMGPNLLGERVENQRNQARSALAEVAKKPQSQALVGAQTLAAFKLFGATEKRAKVDEAQEIANSPGDWETVNVKDYLPDHVQSNTDGTTFIEGGQTHGMNIVVGEDGSIYLVAGKTHKGHLVDPLLIAGARNDASSDKNNDGIATMGERRETLGEFARTNLSKVFPKK